MAALAPAGRGKGGLVTARQSERDQRCGRRDGGESEGWRDWREGKERASCTRSGERMAWSER